MAVASAWLPDSGAVAATASHTAVMAGSEVPSSPASQLGSPDQGHSGQGGQQPGSPWGDQGGQGGQQPGSSWGDHGGQGGQSGFSRGDHGWRGGRQPGCACGGRRGDGRRGLGNRHPWLAVSVTNRGWFRSRGTGAYLVSLTNTGDAPAEQMSVIISLAHGLFPLRVSDGHWRCDASTAEHRETCRYHGWLLPRLRTVLVLPERVDAAAGSYLVGLAHAGTGDGQRVSVDLGLASRLVPVCVGGHHPRGCSVNLWRHSGSCSCRDVRLPRLDGQNWPGGPGQLQGSYRYRPGTYLVSLDGPGGAFGRHVFVDGDLARGFFQGCAHGDGSACSRHEFRAGGVCACRGLLLPGLHTALVLPDKGQAPDGSFPVVQPAHGAASGVSPDGQVVDVAQVQPSH